MTWRTVVLCCTYYVIVDLEALNHEIGNYSSIIKELWKLDLQMGSSYLSPVSTSETKLFDKAMLNSYFFLIFFPHWATIICICFLLILKMKNHSDSELRSNETNTILLIRPKFLFLCNELTIMLILPAVVCLMRAIDMLCKCSSFGNWRAFRHVAGIQNLIQGS